MRHKLTAGAIASTLASLINLSAVEGRLLVACGIGAEWAIYNVAFGGALFALGHTLSAPRMKVVGAIGRALIKIASGRVLSEKGPA